MNKRTICILTTKERFAEAEELFMDMVNDKEREDREDQWNCISHRFSNKNGKISRCYTFEKWDGSAQDILVLKTEPTYEPECDYIVSFGIAIDIFKNVIFM